MASDKSRNSSLKTKAFLLLTTVVVILSAAAVAVSIHITSVMLEKFDQLAKGGPDAAVSLKKTGAGASNTVNLKKAERLPLYLNGASREGMVCYTPENGKSLLPLDMILDGLDAPFDVMNPDDAFTAAVGDKNIMLGLGTEDAQVGSDTVKLDTASVAAEGHILASAGILDLLGGFTFEKDAGSGAAFTYYWPAALDKKYSDVRLFQFSGRKLQVSGMSPDKPHTYGEGGPGVIDRAVLSESSDFLLISSGEQYYRVDGKDYKKPVKLDIEGSWELSPDGGFLYRPDEADGVWEIYDVKSSSVRRIRDIYSGVALKNGASLAERRLLGYEIGKSYTRVDFEGLDGDVYTVVSRGGKIMAQGSCAYSPDRRRLLLYDGAEGWRMADYDGRNIVKFEDVSSADWVDNDRILLDTAKGYAVYGRRDKTVHPAAGPLDYVGKGDDGRVFFTKGEDLYQTVDGVEEKIAGLPWKCDFAVSRASEGPVIGISEEADLIFALSGENTVALGRPGLFPNIPAAGEEDRGFGRNAAFSPDSGRLAVLQKGEKFLEVVLTGLKEEKQERLTLAYAPGAFADRPPVSVRWLGSDSLAVYVSGRAWLIDCGEERTYIREWSGDAPIADIFRTASINLEAISGSK